MTLTPAKTDGPNWAHKKTKDKIIYKFRCMNNEVKTVIISVSKNHLIRTRDKHICVKRCVLKTLNIGRHYVYSFTCAFFFSGKIWQFQCLNYSCRMEVVKLCVNFFTLLKTLDTNTVFMFIPNCIIKWKCWWSINEYKTETENIAIAIKYPCHNGCFGSSTKSIIFLLIYKN